MKPLNKRTKREKRDAYANSAEEASNSGHYLDRLENLGRVLESREIVMAVLALKQLYEFSNCMPKGSDGIQFEISCRILIIAERDFKFTKKQLSRMWYGVHWDTHKMFGLKFPYKSDSIPSNARSNK